MKKTIAMLVLLMFGALILNNVYAQEPKFGYVDIIRVVNEYNKTAKYDKKLEEDQEVKGKEKDKSVEEIKKLQERLSIVSKEEKDKTQKEIDEKMRQLQQFVSQAEIDLRKEFYDMREEIIKEILQAVKDYAEKNNFTFIFQDAALAYKPKTLDITDQIIKILNEGKK